MASAAYSEVIKICFGRLPNVIRGSKREWFFQRAITTASQLRLSAQDADHGVAFELIAKSVFVDDEVFCLHELLSVLVDCDRYRIPEE